MISSYLHKGLRELFEQGVTAKINRQFHARLLRCLDALDTAREPENMDIPGYRFHPLRGFNPIRYSVHINGPWCITFEFDGEDAQRVDFEQYH
ncbi:type II toxin-antitoxin system RelE/ParE family toxin [Methylobacterium sp. JK268]